VNNSCFFTHNGLRVCEGPKAFSEAPQIRCYARCELTQTSMKNENIKMYPVKCTYKF